MYKGKKVLVAGGTGLIGIPVVKMLIERGARVRIVSLDDPALAHQEAEFIRGNLTNWEFCNRVVKGMDYVFNLAGTKGAVSTGKARAASFFVPHLIFNTLLMEAARVWDVERYLYTSTIGIYPSANEPKKEGIAWNGPPHHTNLFAGWAKKMGELQAESYKIEFGWSNIAIVRPANVYGPFDYFDPSSAMVVPSLIRRAVKKEDPFTVWGDGSAVRDFVFADDVAEGILLAFEKAADCTPINLGSGMGVTIKELVDIISSYIPGLNVRWDTSKPVGEYMRVLDITRARGKIGYNPRVSLKDGIAKTIEWYRENMNKLPQHYNVFHKKALIA
ncbi:MAG: NAD-dependent epimerase/dehydratase family protein [Candidatus Brocadia sp.]|nr:NAD-dependent epimerase/dehydratase family protein [Candidatus Brocadia sp.]